jgi:hypothetical protein
MCNPVLDNEDKKAKYKDREGSLYGKEKGTIIKKIVFAHERIVGLELECSDKKGKKYIETVFDKRSTDKPVGNETLVTEEYYYLQSEIDHKAGDKRIQMKGILLKCFCRAYLDDFKLKPNKYFKRLYSFIESSNAAIIFKMIVWMLVGSIVLMLGSYALVDKTAPEKLPYFYGSTLGLIGAFVMIFYSYKDLQLSCYESGIHLVMRYMPKLICGIVFGAITILFMKSKLFLPDVGSDEIIQLSFAFIAGVQSKWIPTIAGNIAEKNSAS